MRDRIEAVRALTAVMITDSMARAESWNAFNNVYARARARNLPPEQAYDEAAEAQVRAYNAILDGPRATNDEAHAALRSLDSTFERDLSVLEQALNRRV